MGEPLDRAPHPARQVTDAVKYRTGVGFVRVQDPPFMVKMEVKADVPALAANPAHEHKVAIGRGLSRHAIGRHALRQDNLPALASLSPVRQPDLVAEQLTADHRDKVRAVEVLAVRDADERIEAHCANTPGVRNGVNRIRTACWRVRKSTPKCAVTTP